MAFRIDASKQNALVRWTYRAHDMPSWVGITLSWQLSGKNGATQVRFEHAGWQGEVPEPVVMGWEHFCSSLKAYCETGSGQPW